MIRIAFDTNILAYLAEVDRHPDDGAKIDAIAALSASIRGKASFVAPVQALGELVVVMRRAGASGDRIASSVNAFESGFTIVPSTERTLATAVALSTDHKLQFWDSMIMAASAEAGCSVIFSEDMQHGFAWQGLTIINPLADTPHPRLAALL